MREWSQLSTARQLHPKERCCAKMPPFMEKGAIVTQNVVTAMSPQNVVTGMSHQRS